MTTKDTKKYITLRKMSRHMDIFLESNKNNLEFPLYVLPRNEKEEILVNDKDELELLFQKYKERMGAQYYHIVQNLKPQKHVPFQTEESFINGILEFSKKEGQRLREEGHWLPPKPIKIEEEPEQKVVVPEQLPLTTVSVWWNPFTWF